MYMDSADITQRRKNERLPKKLPRLRERPRSKKSSRPENENRMPRSPSEKPSEKPNEQRTPRKSGSSSSERRRPPTGEKREEVELVFADRTPLPLRPRRQVPRLELERRSYLPSLVDGEKDWQPSKLPKLLVVLHLRPLLHLLLPLLLEIHQLHDLRIRL
jgi:hypothetical protein